MTNNRIKIGDIVTPKRRLHGQFLVIDPKNELIVTTIYGIHCTLEKADHSCSIAGVPIEFLQKKQRATEKK